MEAVLSPRALTVAVAVLALAVVLCLVWCAVLARRVRAAQGLLAELRDVLVVGEPGTVAAATAPTVVTEPVFSATRTDADTGTDTGTDVGTGTDQSSELVWLAADGSVLTDHPDTVTPLTGTTSTEPLVGTVAPTLPVGTMADIVAKEVVVKSVALGRGLRHALSPATRNKIRFEMKREVKRSRRDRKTEMKVALREFRARQRAGIAAEETSGDNGA